MFKNKQKVKKNASALLYSGGIALLIGIGLVLYASYLYADNSAVMNAATTVSSSGTEETLGEIGMFCLKYGVVASISGIILKIIVHKNR